MPPRGSNLQPSATSPPCVVFDDVVFRYDRRRSAAPALDGASLRLEAGATTALVGGSGSGKSSLGKLLLRLHDPDRGRILVDGVPLDALDVLAHRRRIGVVQQEPCLFDRSIVDNVGYGLDPPPPFAAVAAAAQAAGIHDVVLALADGYATKVGEKTTRLSGGEKQRVALARALVRKPTLLLLDEATSALDADSEASVLAALEAAGVGRTSLVIAHRLSTIRRADTIAVVSQGRVVETGTHDDLLDLGGAYAGLVAKQSLGADAVHREPPPPDTASVTDSSSPEDNGLDHDLDEDDIEFMHRLGRSHHEEPAAHRFYYRSISM